MCSLHLVFILVIAIPSQAINCHSQHRCICTDNAPCLLECIGRDSCKGSDIELVCKEGYPCKINCNGENACSDAQILDNNATDITLICESGISSCGGDTHFNCGTGSCSINCNKRDINICLGLHISVNTATSFYCDGECPLDVPVTFTIYPTVSPTYYPTPINPSFSPIQTPTDNPTTLPTKYSIYTYNPSVLPTIIPTVIPISHPTTIPTINPTQIPTYNPTHNPSITPTTNPSNNPTSSPTIIPTIPPTLNPTVNPTVNLIDNNNMEQVQNNNNNNNNSSGYQLSTTWFLIIIIFMLVIGLIFCISGLYFCSTHFCRNQDVDIKRAVSISLAVAQQLSKVHETNIPQIDISESGDKPPIDLMLRKGTLIGSIKSKQTALYTPSLHTTDLKIYDDDGETTDFINKLILHDDKSNCSDLISNVSKSNISPTKC